MSFLFKGKKQRERDERKERRRATRQAENADLKVLDRIKGLEKDAAKAWEDARTAAQSGQKAAVNRHLTSYRAGHVLITKLEQKRWVFRQYQTKLEAAMTDQEFTSALQSLNKVTNIDPEAVEDVFETASDLLGEQQDSDRFWDQLYTRETGDAEGNMQDHVPSLDELSDQLMTEAAVEVGNASGGLEPELAERIGEGRQRVKNLLDNEG